MYHVKYNRSCQEWCDQEFTSTLSSLQVFQLKKLGGDSMGI